MKQDRLMVIGTGTGVGKTHGCLALLAAASAAGFQVAGLKPVETGVPGPDPSDAARLQAASSFHVKPPPYALARPVSPHRAAREAGVVIDITRIASWVAEHTTPLLVIESAGGALSPLGPRATNLDLAIAVTPTAVLLVAPDRLGVLHDLSATLLAFRTLAPQLPAPLVLLQSPEEPDASTGLNAEDIGDLQLAPMPWVLPRGVPESPAVQVVAASLLLALMRRR